MNRTLLLFLAALALFQCNSVLAQPIAAWTFDSEQLVADSGYSDLGAARTLGSFPSGVGTGKSWSLRGFAPQSTESGQRGWIAFTNTLGMDSVWLSGLMRGSSTSSRWWSVELSIDSGSTWSSVWRPDTGWGPFDTWLPFSIPLPGAGGHSYLGVRAVSIFAPVAFANFGGSFAAHQAYQGMRAVPGSASQNYGTSGTWRWENLKLTGTESAATVWNGQQWSGSAPQLGSNAHLAASYTGSGFTCANLRVDSGVVVQITPGGYLDVLGRAVVHGSVFLQRDTLSTAQLRLGSAGWGSGAIHGSAFWAHPGWHQLASPLDLGITGLSGADSSQLVAWRSDSASYLPPGVGLTARGMGYFGMGSGTIGLQGPLARQPWRSWPLGYASGTSSTVNFSTAVTDGWNLLGNPFWCGLDFADLVRQNVDASFSIWDASLYGGHGGYAYYSPSGGSLSSVIPPLQGFWVRAQGLNSALSSTDQGSLDLGMPDSLSIQLELRDIEQPHWIRSIWLRPDDGAVDELDPELDAANRWSPSPVNWTIETPNGDAVAKRWNPNRRLAIRTEVQEPRQAVMRSRQSGQTLWLVGNGMTIPITTNGQVIQLNGTQHWSLVGERLDNDSRVLPDWRVGPGYLWFPAADEIEVSNGLGQRLLHGANLQGEPLTHTLPQGLYAIRARIGSTNHFFKIILIP